MIEHPHGSPRAAPPATDVAPSRQGGLLVGGLRWFLMLAGLAAMGLFVWWTTSRPAPVVYGTAPVTRGAVVTSVSATGTVNPVLTIIVGTYVSGVIQDVSCDYNTQVREGQVCARIDPRPYQSVVDEAKANLAVAQAQLAKDKASLAYAEVNDRRQQSLVSRNYVSKDAADLSHSTLAQAQAQVGLDAATIEQRQAQLTAAQINLSYTNITSPVDGVVVSRNVTMGQTVAASFQTPTLFLIATNLRQMQVDTNVSESDIGVVREGELAQFTVDAFPGRVFRGAVAQVRQSPQNVQNVITYDVVVNVDNADFALKPGMTASVRIVTNSRGDVLRVPEAALRYVPGGGQAQAGVGARVFMLRDNRPVAIPVVPGISDGTSVEIVQGNLHVGDQLVTAERRGPATAGPLRAPRL